jgi:hypothetical protein
MTEDQVYQAIASQLDETSNPADEFETASRIRDRLTRWIVENGCQHRELVEPTARRLYNQYVRPFDIPGLPNMVIEPRVDDAAEEILVRLLNRVLDRVCEGDDTDASIVAE